MFGLFLSLWVIILDFVIKFIKLKADFECVEVII